MFWHMLTRRFGGLCHHDIVRIITGLHACTHACIFSYRPTDLPACPPACLPTRVFRCQLLAYNQTASWSQRPSAPVTATCVGSKLVSVVRRDLHDWLRVNSVVYNSLVSACASGAQWLKAQEVFFSSQALGVRDREAQAGANAAVEALGRSLLWPQAIDCLELLKPLGSWKLEANIAAYSSALTGCARAKAWACGLELWHATSAVGLSDGSPTLNAVVTSAGQGLWQLAFSLVSSYQADAPTYGAALRACLGEAADVAFGLFEQMRLKKIDPDEAAWATVIMVAARGDTGQRQAGDRLLEFNVAATHHPMQHQATSASACNDLLLTVTRLRVLTKHPWRNHE